MADGEEIIALMRLIGKLQKKYIAIILTDVEREFRWIDQLSKDAKSISEQLEDDGRVDTAKLSFLLERVEHQLPSYYMTRKIFLDNINEFIRNIFQALLGDVEGYGKRLR